MSTDSSSSFQPNVLYSVEQYAKARKLSVEMLKDVFGVTDVEIEGGSLDGSIAMGIPYRDEEGKLLAMKYRVAEVGDNRFRYKPGGKAGNLVYGLHNQVGAKDIRLFVAKGESNMHAAAARGIPMLTIPLCTRNNVKALVRAVATNAGFLEVVVLNDADQPIPAKALDHGLHKENWYGTVRQVNFREVTGVRDLCELHVKYGDDTDGFKAEFTKLIKSAKCLKSDDYALAEPEERYRFTDSGISMVKTSARAVRTFWTHMDGLFLRSHSHNLITAQPFRRKRQLTFRSRSRLP